MTLNLDDPETGADFDALLDAVYRDRSLSPAHKATMFVIMTGSTRCENGDGEMVTYLDFFTK